MISSHHQTLTESETWCEHFRANASKPDQIPWDHPALLSCEELLCIEGSIRQFQLGEGSSGSRLLKRALAYSQATANPGFADAMVLFIKEEQRHSAYLLRFMQLEGIEPATSDWADTVFRRLRSLAGLELSLRVLVSAEIVAFPYYRALREATRSPILQAICTRILEDEAAHLRFQASMLSSHSIGRSWAVDRIVSGMHRMLLLVACHVVWFGHVPFFRATRYSRQRFLEESFVEFYRLVQAVR